MAVTQNQAMDLTSMSSWWRDHILVIYINPSFNTSQTTPYRFILFLLVCWLIIVSSYSSVSLLLYTMLTKTINLCLMFIPLNTIIIFLLFVLRF